MKFDYGEGIARLRKARPSIAKRSVLMLLLAAAMGSCWPVLLLAASHIGLRPASDSHKEHRCTAERDVSPTRRVSRPGSPVPVVEWATDESGDGFANNWMLMLDYDNPVRGLCVLDDDNSDGVIDEVKLCAVTGEAGSYEFDLVLIGVKLRFFEGSPGRYVLQMPVYDLADPSTNFLYHDCNGDGRWDIVAHFKDSELVERMILFDSRWTPATQVEFWRRHSILLPSGQSVSVEWNGDEWAIYEDSSEPQG